MTAKRKSRAVTPADLKRQLAAEKLKNEQQKTSQAEQLAQLMGVVSGLAKSVEALKQTPSAAQALAQHDRNEQVINKTLNLEEDREGWPEKPPVVLSPKLAKAIQAMDARNRPVIFRDTVDSTNQEIGQLKDRPQRSDGPAAGSLAPAEPIDEGVVIENRRFTPEKIKIESFMQELVLMRLFDSTDETQIPVPEVCNGGRRQFFVRGQMQWVKRASLEPLARAKKTTYTQRKVRNDNGDENYINVPHTALMYPFEVLEDTKEGKAWMRGILSEAY